MAIPFNNNRSNCLQFLVKSVSFEKLNTISMKIIITTTLILISFGSFSQSIIKQKQPPTVKLILPQQKFENKLRNAGSALVLSGMFAVISGLTGNDKGVTNVLRAGSGVALVVSGINMQGAVSEYKKIQEQKK